MMKWLISLFLLLTPCLLASAQEMKRVVPVPDRPVRRLVVADMETRVPIRKVVVTSKDGYRDSSNYRGIVHIPKDFDTLRIYKAGYLAAKLTMKEVGDTSFLIPSGSSLREVTVWGKDGSNRYNDNMADGFSRAIQEGAAAAPKGVAHFDFANIIDRRGRRDRKHLKKVKETFKKMDQLDEDPVVNAYKKDQENKRLLHEKQLAKDERDATIRKQKEEALRKAECKSPSGSLQDSLSYGTDSLYHKCDTTSGQMKSRFSKEHSQQSIEPQTAQPSNVTPMSEIAQKAEDDPRKLQEKQVVDTPKLSRKND